MATSTLGARCAPAMCLVRWRSAFGGTEIAVVLHCPWWSRRFTSSLPYLPITGHVPGDGLVHVLVLCAPYEERHVITSMSVTLPQD